MKFNLPKIVLLSLIFACLGITTEVVFTSLSKLVATLLAKDPIDWALDGETYLWMFLIYASIPFIFRLFDPIFGKYHLFTRALIAVGTIYIIEFTSGFALEMITGTCPWKYTSGVHLFGYIRLDYFPFWLVFAILIMSTYHMLDKRLD
jgi:hypothetical protein